MKYDRYTVRRALLSFRDRLNDFRTPKNEKIIDFLLALKGWDEQDFKFPEHDQIAKATGLTRVKVNEIFRNLYERLLESFSEKKWPIKTVTCNLWIGLPWEELRERREKGKEHAEYLQKLRLLFICELAVIPRVGEEIRLDFVDHNARFTHGYVYNVTHGFYGHEQVIDVYAHPVDNPYDTWMKRKDEHEEKVRRKKWAEWAAANQSLEPKTKKQSASRKNRD